MKIKNILIGFSLHIISLVLGIIFIFSISNTKSSKISSEIYLEEETLNVSSFVTDSKDVKQKDYEYIEDFFEDLYDERNSSIETGNVEKLYKYYDISEKTAFNSLEQEFKRIAYFRDWAIQKDAHLSDVDSDITITSVKEKDGVMNITFNEEFSFDFSYNKAPKNKNEFSHNIVHTAKIKDLGNNQFIVLSDYYDDFLKNELDKYKFNLTEKNLIPTEKSSSKLNLRID